MIDSLLKFPELLTKKRIEIQNAKLEDIVEKYSFIYVDEELDYSTKQKIYKNFKESKVAVINQITEKDKIPDKQFIVLCFEKTIIIFEQSLKSFFYDLLSNNKDLTIYYLPNTNNIFNQDSKITNKVAKLDPNLFEEIISFCKALTIRKAPYSSIKRIWKYAQLCIAGYLLLKSYEKLNRNRLEFFDQIYEKKESVSTKENRDINRFIELKKISESSLATVYLVYDIIQEELFAVKIPKPHDPEIAKLVKREEENYSKLNYPLLPKYYGKTNKGQIIEYINGPTLLDIQNLHLTYQEKSTIIYELILIIQYLHENHFIYRDLKPNNVMIDQNKDAVLIDFDRMLNSVNCDDDDEHTLNFSSNYVAPEVNSGHFSYECDIYSLGKLIYYVMNEKELEKDLIPETKVDKICLKCINSNPSQRPTIYAIFRELMHDCFLETKKCLRENNPQISFLIGMAFFENDKYIDKAIHYFTLAADKNHSISQLNLGNIYFSNRYANKRNIPDAIHYFTLAAKQNNAIAQHNLGVIYFRGEDVLKDVSKATNYFQLAAAQNYSPSQYSLGVIYEDNDINKAINYYSLAAKQNNVYAQIQLGQLYFKGEGIPQDIYKSINYFTLAANQGNAIAQTNLGIIYESGKFIPMNISKAIQYYTLAANQGQVNAQYNLAQIYHAGINVVRDIPKAIYYYDLAINQNFAGAEYNMGIMYLDGQYIRQDTKLAIYYLTLAANQKSAKALFALGAIYYSGVYFPVDINKVIHYFLLAADLNNPLAQYYLGEIYISGEYVPQNINKAIYYLTLAANQGQSDAQHKLGIFYLKGLYVQQYVKKGIYYLSLASTSRNINAFFSLGFLYQEGKYVERDINKSIAYYKEASSFNNQYAKNNLGIIYTHGDGDKISPRLGFSIEYFKESIRQKNDEVSMYNLAHLYIYNDQFSNYINEAIELLISSSKLDFQPSKRLLSLVLIKLYGNDYDKILQQLKNYLDAPDLVLHVIMMMIMDYELIGFDEYMKDFEKYKHIDFLYDYQNNAVPFSSINSSNTEQNNPKIDKIKNITKSFYEGFGIEI